MTGVALVLVTLLVVGVFALFWWLVELTGGVAGGALSVCRSMQVGFASWRDFRDEPPHHPMAPSDHGSDERFDVPVETVRGPAPRRRF